MQHAASFWIDLDRMLANLEIPNNQQQKSQYYRIRKQVNTELAFLNRKLDENTKRD